MQAFFLTKEWAALERLVRSTVREPEGMPSVYIPWLRYKARGYDVHVFMVGDFPAPALVDWQGCAIHLVPEARLGILHRLLHGAADNVCLYRAAAAFGRQHPPDVVYALREGPGYAAWALAKEFASVCVKRIYGTWLYSHWFLDRSLRLRRMRGGRLSNPLSSPHRRRLSTTVALVLGHVSGSGSEGRWPDGGVATSTKPKPFRHRSAGAR